MSEHAWFQENLASYLAGGLTIEERERFDRHRVACKPCTQVLAEIQGFDTAMDNLFAVVRPGPGWEAHVVDNLRSARPRRRLLIPRWLRIAACLAVLGSLGAVVNIFAASGGLNFPGAESETKSQYASLNPFSTDLVDGTTWKLTESSAASEGALARFSLLDTEGLQGKLNVNTLSDSETLESLVENLSSSYHGLNTVTEGKTSNLSVMNRGGSSKQTDEAWSKKRQLTELSANGETYFKPRLIENAELSQQQDRRKESVKVIEAFGNKLSTRSEGGDAAMKKSMDDLLSTTKAQIAIAQEKTPPAPETAARKIIRTGDMEFEVDGFDAAVAGITRLISAVPGGFVATVNSDKLPNGKIKGCVVLRLPPEKLDKFLLDLRQELGKAGELKSQRIGSQDVTKQYTDVESRLRGARAMEERFLEIIKTGKGEIKDLIVAENALGVWRTKIEEMEGEIRFYNNQVGLSTLTITLYEKEIQAAAELVISERRKLQLEVEDVDKAHQAALAAVTEARGHVTKSDFKQTTAGQLEATLHFGIAPAEADRISAQLKQLGVVTHQDADRTGQTQGGGSQTATMKTRQNDVLFEVGIYNTANVKPREALVLEIASVDVAAGFRKLQEAVARVKGQVRGGQIDNQDKPNVAAHLDFDVPAAERKVIDQVIAEIGKTITRNATQAAVGEAATDRKIGYRISLKDAAALPARENIALGIEVKDVDQSLQEIMDLVKGAKGRFIDGKKSSERNGQVSAVLSFNVPMAAKSEVLRQLKGLGIVRGQSSTGKPLSSDDDLATVQFEVAVASPALIVPSDEGLWPQIRTSLFYSFRLLSWSLMFVILGVSVILPWTLIMWLGYRIIRIWRKKPGPTT